MKGDDDSLDSKLDRYMGRAGEPPAEQVASSVEKVWRRLRPEADSATLPTKHMVTRRSHFLVAAALATAALAIGLYSAQRAGLQQVQPQIAPPSQSPAVSVDPVREPVTIGLVTESKEPVTPSKPRQPESAAVAEATRSTPQQPAGAVDAPALLSPRSGAGAGLLAQVNSQTPGSTNGTPLIFAVASIQPIPLTLPIGGGPWTVANGRFQAGPAFTRDVIALAYEVLTPQVKGGPKWITQQPYDFDARASSAAAGPNQIRIMLKTLLAERFKLAVHHEMEESLVYRLVIAKNGSKLQDVKDGRPPYINWSGPQRVTFSGNPSLQGLTSVLGGVVGAPVLDETGLRGTYSFSLEFTRPNDPQPRQADSPPDVFTAVREQLGLELLETKRQIEIVVIDHIEEPSPD